MRRVAEALPPETRASRPSAPFPPGIDCAIDIAWSFMSMREVLQVGQCSREFQARTRASAVVLLRCMHVKAGPFCAIASYANM